MKYLLLLDTPFWLVVSGVLGTYAVRLRTRIRGLDDPRLYLSRSERRSWARKQLEQEMFERNLDVVRGPSQQGE